MMIIWMRLHIWDRVITALHCMMHVFGLIYGHWTYPSTAITLHVPICTAPELGSPVSADAQAHKCYDDVIKRKHFPRHWPLLGESNDHRWIPLIRPVTRSFGVSFNQRLSKQSIRRWFETPSPSLWRHSNGTKTSTSTVLAATKVTHAFSEVCITNGNFESPSFFRWRHI